MDDLLSKDIPDDTLANTYRIGVKPNDGKHTEAERCAETEEEAPHSFADL